MNDRSFRNLKIWQKADELFDMITKDAKEFPKDKTSWVITDQILRSISSISANIAEGYGRGGNKEFQRFLIIARGSLSESENWLYKIRKRGFISETRYKEYLDICEELYKMINVFIGELRKQNSKAL